MITRKSSPFIIAEVGINHNGDINNAYKMIQVAKEAGADAIKFQTFKADEFCNKDSPLYETFKECELAEYYWKSIKEICDSFEITFLSTPQNYSDLEILLKVEIKAIKIGSDDLNNLPLIRKYAKTKLPIIMSLGMCYGNEIESAVDVLKSVDRAYPVVLMHCTSLYPTFPGDVNMRKILRITGMYPHVIVGYSDHTLGHCAAILAVGMGARVLETHFTLDHRLKGPDHMFSKDPDELKWWIEDIRIAHEMLGSGELIPSERELGMRNIARRSLTALKDIKEGEIFTETNIGMVRPGNGLPPVFLHTFLNAKSTRNIEAGQMLRKEDMSYEER